MHLDFKCEVVFSLSARPLRVINLFHMQEMHTHTYATRLFRAPQSARRRKSVSDAEQGVNIYSSGLFYILRAAIILKAAAMCLFLFFNPTR